LAFFPRWAVLVGGEKSELSVMFEGEVEEEKWGVGIKKRKT